MDVLLEIQHRQTQKYLIYLALQEIMLDNYQDISMLKNFDNNLRLKHMNIINSLQRNASAAFRFLQGYEEGEETIKQFHEFVTLFEGLHTAVDMGGSTFHDCLSAVEEVLKRDGLLKPTT
jgi:hypothetical protein